MPMASPTRKNVGGPGFTPQGGQQKDRSEKTKGGSEKKYLETKCRRELEGQLEQRGRQGGPVSTPEKKTPTKTEHLR